MRAIYLTFIIFTVVVLGSIAGYLSRGNTESLHQETESQKENVVASSPAAIHQYQNKKLGFTLQYESPWHIANDGSMQRDNSDITIAFSQISKQEDTFDAIVNEQSIVPNFSTKVVLGNTHATIIPCGGAETAECVLIDRARDVLNIVINRAVVFSDVPNPEGAPHIREEIKTILNTIRP